MTQPNDDPHLRIHLSSPEGASTIEQVPGVTIETAREVAALLMSSANTPSATPPTHQQVLAEMHKLAGEKHSA